MAQPQKTPSDSASTNNIRSVLCATNSPRPLHPKIKIGRELIINSDAGGGSANGKPVYMLSQLLKDLDELCGEQEPYIEKKLDDISAALSEAESLEEMPDEQHCDGDAEHVVEADPYEYEFRWRDGKRAEEQAATAPAEESEESEHSEDEDSNMYDH